MTPLKAIVSATCLVAGSIALVDYFTSLPEPAKANPMSSAICSTPKPSAGLIKVAKTAKLSDGEIAYIYLQENLFEVETAKLGMERGTAKEVKSHGKMVAKDHSGVVTGFEKLLKTVGVLPVAPANSQERAKQHKEALAALREKSRKAFDRAYVAHEISNHRAVIKALREVLIPTVENAALRDHFKAVLPAFEHHLATTVEAARRLGVETKD